MQIDSVAFEGEQLRVNYQVFNYVPDFEDLHVHLFLDPAQRDNAGENGDPKVRYFATAEPESAVADFTPDELEGATQVCSLVAEQEHGVIQQGGEPTGNCVPLP